MRYITNVVSDEYGRIMRWEELPLFDENGQAASYTKGGDIVELPDEAEETFDAYCGKKSKIVSNTVVTDMTLLHVADHRRIFSVAKLYGGDRGRRFSHIPDFLCHDHHVLFISVFDRSFDRNAIGNTAVQIETAVDLHIS